ncbi:MAG: hypothetical protein LOD90_00020 [Symbiobacteriaceae bacterium]
MNRPSVCAWCGSAIAEEPEGQQSLCPECRQVDEVEAATPLYPVGERQPFAD